MTFSSLLREPPISWIVFTLFNRVQSSEQLTSIGSGRAPWWTSSAYGVLVLLPELLSASSSALSSNSESDVQLIMVGTELNFSRLPPRTTNSSSSIRLLSLACKLFRTLEANLDDFLRITLMVCAETFGKVMSSQVKNVRQYTTEQEGGLTSPLTSGAGRTLENRISSSISNVVTCCCQNSWCGAAPRITL